MSGQPAEQTDAVIDRSALPRVPGLPWWSAVVIAVIFTAIGVAFDAGAGNKELGAVFATCYVLGCVLAALAVRQSAVFTAVIQPPLILFIAVPTAYFLFHSSEIAGIKDILINCGYPLIERFPLMFFTSAAVLIIGLVRWYLNASNKRLWPDKPATHVTSTASEAPARRVARRFAQTSPLDTDDSDDAEEASSRRSSARRPNRTAAGSTTSRRSGRIGEPSRSRHTRPPENDIAASAAAADRRERMAGRERPARRRDGEPPVDPARQPRRPRPSTREPRRNAPNPYEPADYYERPRRPESQDGYERYGRDPRDPRDARYEERQRPPAPASHHPVSRVRYRSSDEDSRPRTSHRRDDEPWEDR